jgi:acetyl esterase/lipase
MSRLCGTVACGHLTGLPPCYRMVGCIDVFRDGTLDYAARLAQAGVPVECRLIPGAYHAFDFIVPDAPVSRAAAW